MVRATKKAYRTMYYAMVKIIWKCLRHAPKTHLQLRWNLMGALTVRMLKGQIPVKEWRELLSGLARVGR